jgi:CRP/FNR family transcriptional regulator, cyclic AMP receptor protein
MERSSRSQDQRIEAWQAVPLFAGCTRRQLEQVDHLGTVFGVPAGRTLTVEGTPGRECFVLLDAAASVRRADVPLGVVSPGTIAGELALLDRVARSATVVTESPTRLMVLDPVEFRELLEVAPCVADRVLETAARRRDALEATVR